MPVADIHSSEREFIKLLLGLNTGVIGVFFVSQDHLVHSKASRILYAITLLYFAVSLAYCLWAARTLIYVEHTGLGKPLETPQGEPIYENTDFWKSLSRYRRRLNYAMSFFFLGVVSSIALVLWNLRHIKIQP
jgi:hypothetical protein